MRGLSIGIEFIIVVVLGVLLLTLGTGFIQNLFGKINVIGTQVTDKAINDLILQMQSGSQKSGTTIGDRSTIRRAEPSEFAVIVNNREINDACFRVDVEPVAADQSILGSLGCANVDSCADLQDTVDWFTYDPIQWIERGEVASSKVSLQIPEGAVTGDYIFKIFIGRSGSVTDYKKCSRNLNSSAFKFYDDQQFILRVA